MPIAGTGRRLLRSAVALVVLTAMTGCGTGDGGLAAPGGAQVEELVVDGETRAYRVHRPDDAGPRPPLVLVLHALGENGELAERSYGWTDVADREGVLVVHPDGHRGSWNAGAGCCGGAAEERIDDVGFLTALIDHLLAAENVDPERVYVTGRSNGAMMSYALACSTDALAAIAPVAGTMLADCADPDPVSVLHVHGSADPVVQFDGGLGIGAEEVDTPSVPSVIDRWRAIDGCAAPSTTTVGSLTHSVASCAEGREVQLTVVDGGGHEWPGADTVGSPSDDLDATGTIWQFFADHPRP